MFLYISLYLRSLTVRNLPCVVPEIKLGQVTVQVLFADVVICAVYSSLEQGKESLSSRIENTRHTQLLK
jgi:hypothetical protein